MYRAYFKRWIDLLISMPLFILTLPIVLITSIIIFVKFKTNPFFIQLRPGKNDVVFKIIKLKTMSEEKNEVGILLPDNLRLTNIGILIRKLSIDELPQLINVIKGEMSLIGPRPLLVEYLPIYNEYQKKRHLIKPGITGWAQVNGRNTISWDEKFEYDVWYVENISFKIDLKIIYLSLIKVFQTEGINQKENITMEKFK